MMSTGSPRYFSCHQNNKDKSEPPNDSIKKQPTKQTITSKPARRNDSSNQPTNQPTNEERSGVDAQPITNKQNTLGKSADGLMMDSIDKLFDTVSESEVQSIPFFRMKQPT